MFGSKSSRRPADPNSATSIWKKHVEEGGPIPSHAASKSPLEVLIGDAPPSPVLIWEYKSIRLDYKGRGITQEINLMDVDGKRVSTWLGGNLPPLPEILSLLGKAGWEMVSHVVNQDNQTNGVTFHYYNFKRLVSLPSGE